MAETPDGLSGPVWRKSSHSSGNGGNCVEVADGFTRTVPIRDSKNPHGPALTVPAAAWADFVSGVKTGRLA